MIWLTWRQHRKQLLFAVVGLAVLAALMIPTGRQMHRAFVDIGLADCLTKLGRSEYLDVATTADCGGIANRFNTRFSGLTFLGVLFVFLPLLVGLFFGAPLVAREVEHGTHRLVWTQGVTRLRWATVKFGLVVGSALAVAVAYAFLVTWWLEPLSRAAGGRFAYLFFDVQGVAPVGYTVFAVSLGIFAGTMWRRVLPAMAVTLVGFLGLRLAVEILARPNFLSARVRTYPVSGTQLSNHWLGDWVTSRGVHEAGGKLIASDSQVLCGPGPGPAEAPQAADPCAQYGVGAYNQEIYQPAERFWLFQYIETGLFVALAALLLFLAIRQIRRRIA
jgi:hypothetical protein